MASFTFLPSQALQRLCSAPRPSYQQSEAFSLHLVGLWLLSMLRERVKPACGSILIEGLCPSTTSYAPVPPKDLLCSLASYPPAGLLGRNLLKSILIANLQENRSYIVLLVGGGIQNQTGLGFSGKKDSWLRLQREVCGMHVFLYQLVFCCAGSQRVHIGGKKMLQDVRRGAMRCLILLDLPL